MIGVFDSGVGGLSVLQALRAELPGEDFVYLADSGHAPYGERSDDFVLERARLIAARLMQQPLGALVIACNTATAAAISTLRGQFPTLPIVGVEPALKPAVQCSRTGHIGVMATRSTLASAKFRSLLTSHAEGVRVTVRACDGLADAIERSVHADDTSEMRALCASNTKAMGCFGTEKGQIDTLVLGCTHYPFVSDLLRAEVGPSVQLLANGDAVARQTRRLMGDSVQAASEAGMLRLATTGHPQALQTAAERWLGIRSVVEKWAF